MFPSLDRYDVGSIDTETTGLKSTDVPVGLSLSLPDGQDFYFRWGHQLGGNNCTVDEVRRWARAELPKLKACVMHNGPFDMRMTAAVDFEPLRWSVEDTGTIASLLNELEGDFTLGGLLKKRGIGEKNDQELNEWCAAHFGGPATRKAQAGNYWRAPGDVVAPYAMGDSRGTLDLYEHDRPRITAEGLDSLYAVECGQLPIILKLHIAGVRVDTPRAMMLRDSLNNEYAELMMRWDQIAPGVLHTSTAQMARYLDRLGIPYPRNKPTEAMLKKGVTVGNPSIDADYLKKLAAQGHEFAAVNVRMRQLAHYAGTFIDSYILENVDDWDVIHGEFHPNKRDEYGTVSGRYSSGGALNLQNIPGDKVWAPLIRGLFIPYRDGMDWTKFDYSQIEYRFLAHYAGGKLRQAYINDPKIDFHQMVADMTGLPRKPAKNLNFAVVYGQGARATAAQLGVSLDEAYDFIHQYRSRVPETAQLMDRAMNKAADRGYIITWAGRKRRFEKDGSGKYRALHKALNGLLQGSAADLVKKAMIEVDKIIDWDDCIMHLTVHDELDFSIVKGERGDAYRRQIKQAMEGFDLTVPIIADCEVGPDWGHCKEIEL